MISELNSISDIWKQMLSEMHARRFLEGAIWSTGRHCPHCGSVASSALRARTCRLGFYQCRDCHLQFTVATLVPCDASDVPAESRALDQHYGFRQAPATALEEIGFIQYSFTRAWLKNTLFTSIC